jgi:hypothetical protein
VAFKAVPADAATAALSLLPKGTDAITLLRQGIEFLAYSGDDNACEALQIIERIYIVLVSCGEHDFG